MERFQLPSPPESPTRSIAEKQELKDDGRKLLYSEQFSFLYDKLSASTAFLKVLSLMNYLRQVRPDATCACLAGVIADVLLRMPPPATFQTDIISERCRALAKAFSFMKNVIPHTCIPECRRSVVLERGRRLINNYFRIIHSSWSIDPVQGIQQDLPEEVTDPSQALEVAIEIEDQLSPSLGEIITDIDLTLIAKREAVNNIITSALRLWDDDELLRDILSTVLFDEEPEQTAALDKLAAVELYYLSSMMQIGTTILPQVCEEVEISALSALEVTLKSCEVAEDTGRIEIWPESPYAKIRTLVLQYLLDQAKKKGMDGVFAALVEQWKKSDPMEDAHLLNLMMRYLSAIASKPGHEAIYATGAISLFTFIDAHKESLQNFLDQLLSCMQNMWLEDKTVEERNLAGEIFQRVLQQLKGEALSYCVEHDLLKPLLEACSKEDPHVQQVVASAIRACSLVGDKMLQPEIRRYLDGSEAHVVALGNVISIQSCDRPVLGEWFEKLPVNNDEHLAKIAHHALAKIGKRLCPDIYPELIGLYTRILSADSGTLATEETVDMMFEQLNKFKRVMKPKVWETTVGSLEEEHKLLLQELTEASVSRWKCLRK